MTNDRKVKSSAMISQVLKRTEFTLGVIIIALFVLAAVFTQNFTSTYNLTNLTKQGAIVGVMAVAQTIVIITGGIDISGGAVAGLGCMVMALLQTRTGTPFWLTILACVGVTVLCGFINGVIIYDLNVPAMIATLGTQTVIRGIVKLLCGGLNVTYTDARILDIGTGKLFGVVPYLALIWLLVALIIFIVLRYTVFGRNLYVIGSGIEVAKLSGIKVRKMFYLVYSFAGFRGGHRRRVAGRRPRRRQRHAVWHRADGADHQCRHRLQDRPLYPGCHHRRAHHLRRGHGYDQDPQEGVRPCRACL